MITVRDILKLGGAVIIGSTLAIILATTVGGVSLFDQDKSLIVNVWDNTTEAAPITGDSCGATDAMGNPTGCGVENEAETGWATGLAEIGPLPAPLWDVITWTNRPDNLNLSTTVITNNQTWLDCGLYRTPITPTEAMQSVSRGAVWIAYQPNLPPNERLALESVAELWPMVIVAPHPNLSHSVVVTAWQAQQLFTEVDVTALQAFIEQYHHNPTSPTPHICVVQ